METMYTVVGTSTFAGQVKIRWTNNPERVKTMTREGHTDIRFIQMDVPLSKVDSAYFAKHIAEFAEPQYQEAIDAYLMSRMHMVSQEIKDIVDAMCEESNCEMETE